MDAKLPKPFRLELRLRNNRLITARERLGYKTAKAASSNLDLNYGLLCSYERMEKSPVTKRSDEPGREGEIEWLPSAIQISDAYFADPEDLWPKEARLVRVSKTSLEMSFTDIKAFKGGVTSAPFAILESGREGLMKAMRFLPPREYSVIEQRYFEGKTLEELGEKYDLSRTRVAQIENNAYSMLRKSINILEGGPPLEISPIDWSDPTDRVFIEGGGGVVHLSADRWRRTTICGTTFVDRGTSDESLKLSCKQCKAFLKRWSSPRVTPV